MQEWKKKKAKEHRGRELYRLELSFRRGTIKLHCGLSQELSSLVVQLRPGKIELREFLFNRRVPGIEDGTCEHRQGNKFVNYILLECKLFARQRGKLWTEEAKKAWKEGGKSLDIKGILTDGPCTKKAAILIKKTGLTGRSMSPLKEENQCNVCIRT